VWELKENWRMYRSNRPRTLEPVVVGGHGETVLRLLRPGLHSGTVPKLFGKLRHASGPAAHKQHESLHHVKTSLRHFAERDLLAVLAGSKRWGGLPLEVAIHLGTNRIRFELRCPALPGGNVYLDFDERAGSLLAGFTYPPGGPATGWPAHLNEAQTLALVDAAVIGFYKLAGVEVERIVADGIVPPPSYANVPESWIDWVQTWELDQASEPVRVRAPSVNGQQS